MLSAGEVVVPPHSHSKVAVINPLKSSSPNAVNGTFGFVSPRVSLPTCLVAYGVADSPTWVQVANMSDEPLKIDTGFHLCYFHPREEWDTASASIDPTVEDIRAEELAIQAAKATALQQQKQNDFVSPVLYESVTKSRGSSLRNESHTGTLDGHTLDGANGEGGHGLIIRPPATMPSSTLEGTEGSSSSGVVIIRKGYHPTALQSKIYVGHLVRPGVRAGQ